MLFHSSDRKFYFLEQTSFFALAGILITLPISIAMTEICTVILISAFLLSFLLHMIYQKPEFLSISRSYWISGIVLFIWCLITVFFSPEPMSSLKHFFGKWASWVLLVFATANAIKNEKQRDKLLWVLIISSFLIAIDGLIQYLFGTDLIRSQSLIKGIYPSGPFIYHQLFAVYLLCCFFIGLGMYSVASLKVQIFFVFYHLLILTLLLLTYSRGAWLSWIIASVGFFLFSKKKRALLTIPTLLCISLFLPRGLLFRIEQSFIPTGDGGRLDLWSATLKMIMDHPVFGVGLGQYSEVISQYYSKQTYAHNSYLQFAAEAGLPGILFLILFIFLILKPHMRQATFSNRLQRTSIFWAICAYLIYSFFDNFFFSASSAPLLAVLLGVLLSYKFSRKEENLTL